MTKSNDEGSQSGTDSETPNIDLSKCLFPTYPADDPTADTIEDMYDAHLLALRNEAFENCSNAILGHGPEKHFAFVTINPACDEAYERKSDWYKSKRAVDAVRKLCAGVSRCYCFARHIDAEKTHFHALIALDNDHNWRFKPFTERNGYSFLMMKRKDWCISIHKYYKGDESLSCKIDYLLKEGYDRPLIQYLDYYSFC